MNDDTQVNECGHPIRNIHEINITYVDHQTLVCPQCKNRMRAINSFEQCPKCLEYNTNDIFENIRESCESFDFFVQDKQTIQYFTADIAELYKIKIELPNGSHNSESTHHPDSTEQIYGIMICRLSFEENDWSSTPHNFFMTEIFLFRNKKNRNRYYLNLLKKYHDFI